MYWRAKVLRYNVCNRALDIPELTRCTHLGLSLYLPSPQYLWALTQASFRNSVPREQFFCIAVLEGLAGMCRYQGTPNYSSYCHLFRNEGYVIYVEAPSLSPIHLGRSSSGLFILQKLKSASRHLKLFRDSLQNTKFFSVKLKNNFYFRTEYETLTSFFHKVVCFPVTTRTVYSYSLMLFVFELMNFILRTNSGYFIFTVLLIIDLCIFVVVSFSFYFVPVV